VAVLRENKPISSLPSIASQKLGAVKAVHKGKIEAEDKEEEYNTNVHTAVLKQIKDPNGVCNMTARGINYLIERTS